MTQRFDTPQFSRVGHGLRLAACAILLALVSGCAAETIEEFVPSGSASTQTKAAAQQGTASASSRASGAAADEAGPKDTGSFPNLNIVPEVANSQITDEEKAAQTSDLRATQQGTAATAATLGQGITDPVLLRKIAAQHEAEALKKIDAQK